MFFFNIVCFHHPGFFKVSTSGRSGHRWNKEAEQGSASAGNFGTTHLEIKYQADLYLEFGFSVARDSTSCKINGVTRFQATFKSTIWWNYDSWPSQLTPNVLEYRQLDFHVYVYFVFLPKIHSQTTCRRDWSMKGVSSLGDTSPESLLQLSFYHTWLQDKRARFEAVIPWLVQQDEICKYLLS